MELFSFSRLNKYLDCPGAFYRSYCMKIPEAPSLPLVNGKAVHSIIETAMWLGRRDALFFETIAKTIADNAPLKLDTDELVNLTYQDNVLNEFHPDNKVEQHIKAPLEPENPMSPMIQGYIDVNRDEGEYIQLIDWKSNRISYLPTDTMQLALYAWALNQIHQKPVRGKFIFLRTKETPEHEFSLDEMKEAQQWAINLALEIQDKLLEVQNGEDYNEAFKPTPGGACRYCGYSKDCIDGELTVPGEIKTYDQAQRIGSEIIRMESALEQIKGLMKDYVKTCGPVLVPGREFVMQGSSYLKWTPVAIQAAYERMLIEKQNPFAYFNLTATQVNKLGWGEKLVSSMGARKVNKAPALKHIAKTS